MARMIPAVCPTMKDGATISPAERQLFARLARELDGGWQVIHRCAVRTGDDSPAFDFVLLHRDYGIAVLEVARPGEGKDPARLMAAMRARLEEIGFARRYPGNLAIIIRRVAPDAVSDLAAFLAVRFAAVPVSAVADPTWPDWLMQRLAPDHRVPEQRAPDQRAPDHRVSERSAPETGRRAAAAATGLRAPTADDAWLAFAGEKPRAASPPRRDETRAGAPPAQPSVHVAPERIPVSRDAETRSPLWTGMVLSVFVVAVVLVGIAALSHGNGSHDILATQSAARSPPATPSTAPQAAPN
jgi:hypothetical protein